VRFPKDAVAAIRDADLAMVRRQELDGFIEEPSAAVGLP
jgi:hypothetical protein